MGVGESEFLKNEGTVSLHSNEMAGLFSDLPYRLPHKKNEFAFCTICPRCQLKKSLY